MKTLDTVMIHDPGGRFLLDAQNNAIPKIYGSFIPGIFYLYIVTAVDPK